MASSTTRRRASRMSLEDRRTAILEAVVPLVTRRGPTVTAAELATAAEVSEGTIFHAFGDKESLIDAVLASALDPGPIETAIEAIEPTRPFEEQLVEATAIIQRRVLGTWRLISYLHERRPTSVHDAAPAANTALGALMAAGADRLRVPPAEAADTLRWLAIAASHPMLCPEPRPAAEVVDRFLHGCAAQGRVPGRRSAP